MARLRNRIVKADFWTDPELLRWPRDKRETYRGLWAVSEDSGCLEDDPFGWKLVLWPSPVDADITMDLLAVWRDELIDAGKLIRYEADGKHYLYLTRFHQHEHPRNPQRADLPLPTWVTWEGNKDDARKGRYREDSELIQSLYNEPTSVPVLPCPVLPCPDLKRKSARARETPPPPVDKSPKEAETLAVLYGIKGFPRDEQTEVDLLRESRDPRVDVLVAARGFKDWVADQRDKGKTNFNFRSSWRNRLANEEKFCKERNGPLPASHAPWKPPDVLEISEEQRQANVAALRRVNAGIGRALA